MESDLLEFAESGEKMMVDVDFDFVDPRPEFNIGTRPFLYSLFDERCPILELADIIAGQVEVGTYLITDNGESAENSVVGFITLLDLNSAALAYEKAYIASHLPVGASAGLLLYERVLNIPIELVAPLHSQLVQDVQWAREHTPLPCLFEDIFIIARCEKSHNAETPNKRKGLADYAFFKQEDPLLAQHATETTVFEAEGGRSVHVGVGAQQPLHTDESNSTHKVIMRVKWQDYLAAVQEFDRAFRG